MPAASAPPAWLESLGAQRTAESAAQRISAAQLDAAHAQADAASAAAATRTDAVADAATPSPSSPAPRTDAVEAAELQARRRLLQTAMPADVVARVLAGEGDIAQAHDDITARKRADPAAAAAATRRCVPAHRRRLQTGAVRGRVRLHEHVQQHGGGGGDAGRPGAAAPHPGAPDPGADHPE